MISQYPHILKYNLVTGYTTSVDGNGDTVITIDGATAIEIKCRFEPNSKGQTITTNDGKLLVYNWMIYMPLGEADIPNKMEVIGYNSDGTVKGSGKVERFDRGQLNAQAWV